MYSPSLGVLHVLFRVIFWGKGRFIRIWFAGCTQLPGNAFISSGLAGYMRGFRSACLVFGDTVLLGRLAFLPHCITTGICAGFLPACIICSLGICLDR